MKYSIYSRALVVFDIWLIRYMSILVVCLFSHFSAERRPCIMECLHSRVEHLFWSETITGSFARFRTRSATYILCKPNFRNDETINMSQ